MFCFRPAGIVVSIPGTNHFFLVLAFRLSAVVAIMVATRSANSSPQVSIDCGHTCSFAGFPLAGLVTVAASGRVNCSREPRNNREIGWSRWRRRRAPLATPIVRSPLSDLIAFPNSGYFLVCLLYCRQLSPKINRKQEKAPQAAMVILCEIVTFPCTSDSSRNTRLFSGILYCWDVRFGRNL